MGQVKPLSFYGMKTPHGFSKPHYAVRNGKWVQIGKTWTSLYPIAVSGGLRSLFREIVFFNAQVSRRIPC